MQSMQDQRLADSGNSPGARIRAFRKKNNLTLEDFAESIARAGHERPSSAKLSRIETGEQPVPAEMVEVISRVTRIPTKRLRPDLAALFSGTERA